jgi:hypothetical protein
MSRANAMSEDELIAQARADLGDDVSTLLEALEAFYGNGFADEQAGEADYLDGHVYRVHRSFGFEPDELEPLAADDYCSECGQVGCGWSHA